MTQHIFQGTRKYLSKVTLDGRELSPHTEVMRMADQLDWGYHGVMPTQLAVSVLYETLRLTHTEVSARMHTRRLLFRFRDQWLSQHAQGKAWTFTTADVQLWTQANGA